jgi:hypothetical protein
LDGARSMLRPPALERVKHGHLVGCLLFSTTFRIQGTPGREGQLITLATLGRSGSLEVGMLSSRVASRRAAQSRAVFSGP